MADKTITYLTSDWKIWTYQPFDSRFILDFSQLDDANTPLSGTEGSVKALDAMINSLTISEGSAVNQGIFSQITPASLDVTLIIENFTASDSQQFFVGADIWATYRNAATSDNSYLSLGKNTPAFMGKIRSFTVTIEPGSNFASVNISATSYNEDNLNTVISVAKDTTTDKSVLISNAAAVKNIVVQPAASNYHFATSTAESKTLGEFVIDLNTCDMHVITDRLSRVITSPSNISFTPQIYSLVSTTASPARTYDSTNITDLQLDWSGADSPTGVTLTNYFNNTIVYQYGTDGTIAAGGAYNYSATIDVKDITEMTDVGQKMMSMVKAFKPVTITTKTATNYQNLTFKDDTTWTYPTNLSRVTETIAVNMPTYGLSSVPMLVTGRTMMITPDNWTTTYQLWKGFTN
jgi:hypothetical protein